jgi:hypothetical protein
MARLREKEIKSYCRVAQADLRSRNISFACRVYSEVPVIHGFLINDKQLFVSMCSVGNQRLVGSPNPYLFVERPDTPGKDVGGAHLLTVFETWFQHLWRKGRRVWPE